MKQHLHSYRLLLIAAAICTLAAFWLLGARIGVEQTQRQVDVVISYEDTVRLADASGVPVQEWLTQLSDAGVRELLVTPDEQAKPDIVRAAQDAGLTLAQAGGLAQGGTYFFAARYDTLAAAGQTGVDTDTEPLPQARCRTFCSTAEASTGGGAVSRKSCWVTPRTSAPSSSRTWASPVSPRRRAVS